MSRSTNEGPQESEIEWKPWVVPVAAEGADEGRWVARMRLQTFRLILALGTAALIFMVVRAAVLSGEIWRADCANAVFFGLLLVLSFARPGWLRVLTWLGLVSLFLNVVDGLDFHSEEVITPVHLLLPLLILYAALLGDIYMSLTAMLGVLSIYAATWLVQGQLDLQETLMLTNLIILTILSGTAALAVWLRHSRLERALDLQAKALRVELETRLRVQAMVTHDIRTPLTALVNAAELDDPQVVQEMAGRIAEIVDAAQDLSKGMGIKPTAVSVADIWRYMSETFSTRLSEKQQTVETEGDPKLVVQADLPILCNSVIGNFLANALKFSPRGSVVRMVAGPAGDYVRIAVIDQGPGLPAEVSRRGPEGPRHHSEAGTEGERGTGYGLQIAALCAARMHGSIEIGVGAPGGAISVLMPRAVPLDVLQDPG